MRAVFPRRAWEREKHATEETASRDRGPGWQDRAYFTAVLMAAQHAPSGQQSPSGQHDAFTAVLTAAQQSPSGQQSLSGQHDAFATVVLAV